MPLPRLQPSGRSCGQVTVAQPGVEARLAAVARQADGKLLLAGVPFQGLGGVGLQKLFLTRLEADGDPDPSFGTGGSIDHSFNAGQPVPGGSFIAWQSGKLVTGSTVLAGQPHRLHGRIGFPP